MGFAGGGFFAGSFSRELTLTLRVLPSDKLIEDAVGTGAGAACVDEPDATGMLLDLLFLSIGIPGGGLIFGRKIWSRVFSLPLDLLVFALCLWSKND